MAKCNIMDDIFEYWQITGNIWCWKYVWGGRSSSWNCCITWIQQIEITTCVSCTGLWLGFHHLEAAVKKLLGMFGLFIPLRCRRFLKLCSLGNNEIDDQTFATLTSVSLNQRFLTLSNVVFIESISAGFIPACHGRGATLISDYRCSHTITFVTWVAQTIST